MKKKFAILLVITFITILTSGCSEKHVLNEKYPKKVSALLLGVERCSLAGKFSQGNFKALKELFTTTEYQKHKKRVIERVNELKLLFAESTIIAKEFYNQYQKLNEKNKIFNFYMIDDVSFKDVPYLVDIQENGIDRSLKKIRSRLKSNLIIEVRPTKIIYNEERKSKELKIKADIIIFDVKQNKIVFRKSVDEESSLDKSFYQETTLKKGEKPSQGFQKIKVTFNIENYKQGIIKLAKKIVPKIIKILSRPEK